MSIDKSNLGNIQDFFNATRNYPYSWIFGGGIPAIIKPFSTNINITGYPHHEPSIWSNTGLVGAAYSNWAGGADSSGLNPYGINTLGEGIVSGPNKPADLDLFMDRADVRTQGIKFPMQVVGWGFDIFGYPAPNYNRVWDASGVYNPDTKYSSTYSPTGGLPAPFFHASGGAIFVKGHDVPYDYWKAGPVDLRWDIYRKVWTSPNSVQAGKILRAYNSGSPVANYDVPIFSSGLTYDAIVQDGEATRIVVTGVASLGPRPYDDAYKVYPASSGSFCLIVHNETSGIPRFGVWANEVPGTFACSSSGSSSSSSGTFDTNLYSLLSSNPLGTEYGGIGTNNIPSGALLFGNPNGSGAMLPYNLEAGSGIEISFNTISELGGSGVSIAISSDVLFTEGGVNSSITELQGLTTPLSVAQGGTGSSTKNFLDLSSNQTAGGLKTFPSGLRVGSGTLAVPSISFSGDIDSGFYLLPTQDGFGVTASSTGMATVRGAFGIDFAAQVRVLTTVIPTGASSNYSYAPLVVRQYYDPVYNNHIQTWLDRGDNLLSYVDQNGSFWGRGFNVSGVPSGLASGALLNIHAPSSFAGNSIICKNTNSGVYFSVNKDGSQLGLGASGNTTTLTSTSGNRTIHFSSGYHGSVEVAKVSGGIRTLHFMHGIFTGFTDS